MATRTTLPAITPAIKSDMQVDRALLHKKMQDLCKRLRPFYKGDERKLQATIEKARHGDAGTVGDFSVIAWAAGELAVIEILQPKRKRKQKRKRKTPKK